MSGMTLPTLTVDELTSRIQALFYADAVLQNLVVVGEIAEITRHTSGHVYFTLTGDEGRLSCVLFKSDAARVPSWPKKGDEVLAEGRIGLYPPRGTYQLYVRRLTPLGVGAAARAKEELRLRLEKEGLFDLRLKRKLPDIPKKVAVITSATGAAIRDVLKVSHNRFPQCDIIILPCLVQGYDAPVDICTAFSRVRTLNSIDAVMLVRGGGSREDLNPFDDERVVRAIRSCPFPVVTGVGHEIDMTLSDLAADVAASTPSAAAERLFPDKIDLLRRVEYLSSSLLGAVRNDVRNSQRNLNLSQDALTGIMHTLVRKNEKELFDIRKDMLRLVSARFQENKKALIAAIGALNALSPLSILSRGFISCTREDGTVVSSVKLLHPEDKLALSFIDGRALVRIEEVQSS
ncbi:MAG TPA: exodeoxyribonuclease VII large subunit [Aminobacterium sp.]|uniref:exodeoxyribonuclease VII large subunit n=1 Tax=Aminobacterium TaxID=81466 RepID=UPI0004B2274C|nr:MULTISPECIES: exodeoxyribonuclease VII large subunit [Aminobacterium]HCA40714.1 exodeoxyribonuclease VII large subunit [Aminobacterium sp.]